MKQLPIYIILFSFLYACAVKSDQDIAHHHNASAQYTCPMHPTVIRDMPGQCPVCGMDLVLKAEPSSTNSMELMLNDTQIKLANVTIQEVSMGSIGQTVPINAWLAINENFTESVSARTSGRIERLHFKESGKDVKKGEALYELYSEELLTLQKEYLLAKVQYERLGEPRYKSFYDAAEKKLLLYGLSKEQVSALNEQNLKDRITFLSPISGIIKEVYADEGNYVSEGSLLYKIENNSQLWVEAELYAKEAEYLKRGDKVRVQTAGIETWAEATVTFLSPELRAGTQVMIVRATLPNPTLKLKPGQSAQVLLKYSQKQSITIPTDAVIRDGRGTHVFVQTDHNTFAPRVVQTGIENFDSVEITAGLTAGEKVVATGAYLLYSELVLKKDIDPMMDMSPTHIH
ncbi:MAG: efflux RND transporter periplasmic adaptor subunit [Cyclobacteriaceae bacterium]|jgi:membrane fusion protein, copper/silver efflux system|nr:efflux RND transporter periplasmic adaptor subunit [Cyclobacteriaceae bacterium]